MVPSDLKFDFSFIEEHIKIYVAETNSFFDLEKDRANDPSAANRTYVSMQ